MRKSKELIVAVVLVLTLAMVACTGTAEATSETLSSQDVSLEGNSEIISEEADSQVEEISEVGSPSSEESTETVSEETPAETGETVSEEASESVEVVSEEVSEPEEPEYTVENYDAVLFVKKAVNVRKGPSTDYEKIGGLGKGEQIQVTGIADTGWYQIQYNDVVAYVSSSYLMDEASYQAMIAEEEAAALAAEQAAQQQAAEQAAQQQAAEQAAQQQAAEQAAQQQTQVSNGDYKSQVVALMNQERAAAGVGGISQNASLDAVAQIRAQEIVQSFAHTRPNGTSCFTVLNENGIVYVTAGENIAAGYGTPAEVMSSWMNSEGHRANILNGSFGQVGIGYYADPNTTYGTYWVQIFTN